MIKSFQARVVAFGACICLGGMLSNFVSDNFVSVVHFWLPGAIFVSGLLVTETRRWPWLILALGGPMETRVRSGP